MTMTANLVYTLFALLSYLAVFCYLFKQLLAKQAPKIPVLALLCVVGLGLHAIVLWQSMMMPHGINFDVFNMLSFTSLLMLMLSIILSCYRPVLALNLLGIPVAMFGLIVGYSLSRPPQFIEQHSLSLDIHIILSLSAYAVLLMASIQALLLWFQHRELKKKQKRLWVNLLPPLQAMERLLFDLIIIGFSLLSCALVIGIFTIEDFFGQHLAHKTFFSFFSWGLYAILLWGHYKLGWRGLKAVRMNVIAFGLLALGFIGSKFVLEMILKR